jgi:hypothetical protein
MDIVMRFRVMSAKAVRCLAKVWGGNGRIVSDCGALGAALI